MGWLLSRSKTGLSLSRAHDIERAFYGINMHGIDVFVYGVLYSYSGWVSGVSDHDAVVRMILRRMDGTGFLKDMLGGLELGATCISTRGMVMAGIGVEGVCNRVLPSVQDESRASSLQHSAS